MAVCMHAEFDPSFRARIRSRRPLLYAEGADPATDRPAHVRATSGLAWFGEHLAVIQDDANFIALIDPADWSTHAVTLPAGPGGRRQFDDVRGNKAGKLDLEACITVPTPSGPLFLALGSGSSGMRERLVTLRGGGEADPSVEVHEATALYRGLRDCPEFSGSELNVEGAVFLDGVIRLFNRGNGAPRDEREPVNASCDLDWSGLRVSLENPLSSPPPAPRNVVQYELGTLDGLPLGFTDVTRVGDALLYSAAAEDSPDAIQDGPVAGSVLGILLPDRLRWAELEGPDGRPFTGKVEGICPSRSQPNLLYAVIDTDEPGTPAELCEVELSGPWTGADTPAAG